MPELSGKLNTSYLGNSLDSSLDSDKETMVKVDNVSMVFNIANQKLNSLKEYFIALARHELRFKEFRALDGVSFEVKKGDVFGILGTNGSGKSTMLKIVAGVLEPTEGSVEVKGRIAPLIELGAGFDMDLTARENVFLNGALLGYPKKFIAQHMDEIIDFAEIEQFMDMPLKNYSSGMIARIAFAIATVIVPEVLIVDEVLSVGDFMFQQKCERRITDIIKDHGVTVLIVSHNNDQVERLCNKAIWIEKGHTRMMGKAGDVCRAYRVVGGRAGSLESENRVIEMMQLEVGKPADYYGEVSGNDRYATCVNIADECCDGQKTAILAPSDDMASAMVATGLASVIDALVLNTACDNLPGVTGEFFKRIGAEQAIVMDSQGHVEPRVTTRLEETGIGDVQTMPAGLAKLSLAAYEHGRTCAKAESWGDTAVLAWGNAESGLISLAPYVFSKKAPVFFLDPDDAKGNDQICSTICRDFSRVVVVEQGILVDDATMEKLEKAGVSIVRFSSDNPCQINKTINKWIMEQGEADGGNPADEMLVSTVWEPVDAYFIGQFAATRNALVLMANPNDLDETAAVFDFMDELGGSIDKLMFIGGKSRFNDDDRATIVRSMFATCRNAGKPDPSKRKAQGAK